MSSLKPCGCENPDTKELESTTICTNCGFVSLTRDWNRISLLEKKLVEVEDKLFELRHHPLMSKSLLKPVEEAIKTIRNMGGEGDEKTK